MLKYKNNNILNYNIFEVFVENKIFKFWNTDLTSSNLKEFKFALCRVSKEIIQHHMEKNDFSRWLNDVLKKHELSKKVFYIESNFKDNSNFGRTLIKRMINYELMIEEK
jgi:hypothetical protein